MYVNVTDHYFTAKQRSKPKLGLVRTHIRGIAFEFLTASGVFSKRKVDFGTRLLIESMVLPGKGYVLDMGCGYGAIGIAAGALNPNLRVIMVDVNERAIRLAKRNVKLNNVNNVEVKRGDLYEPVEGLKFDCVLLNPPMSAGMGTVKAMVVRAPKYMVEGASFQMVVRSNIGGERLRRLLEETFGNVKVLARKGGYRVLMSVKSTGRNRTAFKGF